MAKAEVTRGDATPTEARPFLGKAVSSTISQASRPPTSASACRHSSYSKGALSHRAPPIK